MGADNKNELRRRESDSRKGCCRGRWEESSGVCGEGDYRFEGQGDDGGAVTHFSIEMTVEGTKVTTYVVDGVAGYARQQAKLISFHLQMFSLIQLTLC